jgi:hypothetical protein
VGSPRRRNQRRDLQSPEALADRLPDDLRTFPSITDPQGFAIRARQIAEWLNTQSPGLGYETPAVMAAAGLTASAWYKATFAVVPAWTLEPAWEPLRPHTPPEASEDAPEPSEDDGQAVEPGVEQDAERPTPTLSYIYVGPAQE